MKIAHLTSVHPRYDTRIFNKECRSLARNGYEVSLVVADGKGDEKQDGVFIFDVGRDKSRMQRMVFTTKRVFQKAITLNADLYHIHDPELIPAGLRLKRKNKIVIFDSHEDVPLQILSKPYLSPLLRKCASNIMKIYELAVLPKFSALVTATPAIRDKFNEINSDVVDINNYPLIDELITINSDRDLKKKQVCFIGGMTKIRGISELVKAIALTKSGARLVLGGTFSESSFEQEVKSIAGWDLVDSQGFLERNEVKDLLANCMAGLVTFHPSPNHLNAQPNKMFEYMSAGIPVIASHFHLWKDIVEKNNCGICVDPLNPTAIAEAIDDLVTHPDKAQEMGKNGRKAIEIKYNWDIEEQKLLKLYQNLLKK
jgi:glycosyltransferase involved in cell wall biosynthesis